MDYIDKKKAAQGNRRDIWKGSFIPPWEWRRRKLGARRSKRDSE